MVVVWVEFDLTCRPFSTPYLTCLSNNEFCGFIRINQNSLRRLTYFSSVNEIDGSSTMIRPRTRQYMTMHTHTHTLQHLRQIKSLLSVLPSGLCQMTYYQGNKKYPYPGEIGLILKKNIENISNIAIRWGK